MQTRAYVVIIAGLGLYIAPDALATVTVYYNYGNHAAARAAWMSDMGSFTRIPFTGYPQNTIITTQYQSLGVTFTDGTDRIDYSQAYVDDGVGLNGALDTIHLAFSQPMFGIAVDLPDFVRIALYWHGDLTYTSQQFGSRIGGFGGLISTEPFDTAILSDSGLFIDDLFFGPPVPAPGALALLALAGLMRASRRRTPC